ncbi:MAG: RNase adapter RapZ [Bacilli bacterium]|nr:RNase adapter RapZ [Bacilli bacterium]MDY6430304.1 RNase adapter RapZ [Bacilli bacterium]
MNNLIVLTGVSGAGKTAVSHSFEERGFRIIENLPNVLLPGFLNEVLTKGDVYSKTLLILEIRHAFTAINIIRQETRIKSTVLVLDTQPSELLTRYRLNRNIHPLQAKGCSLEDAIKYDAEAMLKVRPLADLYVDTTGLSVAKLREIVIFNLLGDYHTRMMVVFYSFGFKYGMPQDAETVFDCRNVPNPFWVKELQDLTGLDYPVIEWLEEHPETDKAFHLYCDYLESYLEMCKANGRNFVSICFGCSGGQHRSVYFADRVYRYFKDRNLYVCSIIHREMDRYKKNND